MAFYMTSPGQHYKRDKTIVQQRVTVRDRDVYVEEGDRRLFTQARTRWVAVS